MSGTAHEAPAIGQEPGRARVGAQTDRELGTGAAVLPELALAPDRQRPWWLHPSFIVSVLLTVLTGLGALGFWIFQVVTDDSVSVSNLQIQREAGNVTLRWEGPDAAYALFEVSGDGAVTDLTQLVRGTTASVFSAAQLFDERSCFVVRPASRDGEVSLDAATLQTQNGASVCVSGAQ